MADMEYLANVTDPRTVVVDMDTGTVLGTNLRLVYATEEELEDMESSEEAALRFGWAFGKHLYVDLEDD